MKRRAGVDLWRHERRLWDSGHVLVAGLDEAGRGPWAGPVVAAAVILDPEQAPDGIYDSKALTPKHRDALYKGICRAAVAFSVGSVERELIDRINILEATRLAMLRALEALRQSPHALLVDALRIPQTNLPQYPLIKGDQLSVSIAAASIVAKVTRDRLMTRYETEFPGYGFAAHKGYGTPQHRKALFEMGPCPLHRRSFRPVRQLILARELGIPGS